MEKVSKTTVILIVIVILLMLVPLFLLPGAEFGGSDDAGSEMVAEVIGEEHEPWFEPILETILGGELPGEMETLFFCVQTGIGVGILAYCFGYLAARRKYGGDSENDSDSDSGHCEDGKEVTA